MGHETFTLIATSVAALASIFYIPKDKYRLALLSVVTSQAITWAASLVMIELGLYSFPVREFPHATQSSFLHLFVFYPAVFTWFILLFPTGASLFKRAAHYLIFISAIVWFEYYMAVYTKLKEFYIYPMSLQIAGLYIRFVVYFYACRRYITWMVKKTPLIVSGTKAPE